MNPLSKSPVSRMGGLASLLLLAALAGCAVGPDYKRPTVDVPGQYRTAGGGLTDASATNTFANVGWWDAFGDPQLTQYIGEALTNNWDVKIAAARVLQAEASLRVTRSQFFPNIALGGDLTTSRSSENGPGRVPSGVMDPQAEYGTVFGSMSTYEIDLWGRIRRANEAARANLLATEAARQAVRQTLVSQVASAYLRLLELDYELEISRKTLEVRKKSLELTTARDVGGVSSLQDVIQARVLVSTAEGTIVDVLRRQEQTENELAILLGRNPSSIQRGLALTAQPSHTIVPAGLPSSLLERRPDVRSSEQDLVAANANIGEARAAFFPQLTLTGMFGYQSVSLGSLFEAPAQVWQFGPTLTFPVFTGGRLRGQYQFAKARFDEAVARYQQTVQGAFREVSDGLIQHQRSREFTVRQEQTTQARREAAQLANVRYEGGVTSYLEVLYSEQELFNAELQLAQAMGSQLLSVVQLYRALGGGWENPAPQLQTNAANR